MSKNNNMTKSKHYIESYEKPKLVEYFDKLSQDLPWMELAECMISEGDDRIAKLRVLYDKGILPAIRAAVLSQIQSCKVHAGKELEIKVKLALETLKVSFGMQVCVKDNKIISKRIKGCNIVDFIIPAPVVGKDLRDYTIISTKTSTRERSSQDNHFICKKMVRLTHDKVRAKDSEYVYVVRDTDLDKEQQDLINKLNQLDLQKHNVDELSNKSVSEPTSHKENVQRTRTPKTTNRSATSKKKYIENRSKEQATNCNNNVQVVISTK